MSKIKMKVLIAIVCSLQLVAGFSNCPKYYRAETNLYKYLYDNLENYEARSVPREDVTFRLWTRDQTNAYIPLYYGHLRDEEAIRTDKPVKFIIHGWSDCADAEWYPYLRKEFLKKDDMNVIEIDWRDPAGALYPVSAVYTKEVGKYVGEFLVDLNNALNIPFENMHLIGHSLGAHISGFAGNHVDKTTKKTIGRITGMDPAGPLFLLSGPSGRLSSGDATFVDVIHTDGGKLGHSSVLGHIDFYPNGGSAPQPGCILMRDIIDVASCSHTRSYNLFGESINSKEFIAKECSTYRKYKTGACEQFQSAIMGENVDQSVRGVFYLTTNGDQPFARNGTI